MAGGREYDPKRLKELIVYIADKSANDSRFGKTKLNKILFFSDFEAYRTLGKSITGAEYQRLRQGPAPHQLLPALNELQASGSVVVRGEQTFAGTQHRVVSLRDADTDAFSDKELATVDAWIVRLLPMTNTEVSDLSHDTIAWQLTSDSQQIPYGAAVLSPEQPNDDDVAWLKSVLADDGSVATA